MNARQINIGLLDAFNAFSRRVIGTMIRHQCVVTVELRIEIRDPLQPPRFVLTVLFMKKVSSSSRPTERLLEDVFCQIPEEANYATKNFEELMDILLGRKTVVNWLLSDEIPAKPPK